ncbi:MAG: LolA family protein [Solirubrobacteraceae bacterium]
MSGFLRQISVSRLLALCAATLAVGIGATAVASAVGGGPVPAPKPLAAALHDALSAQPVEGVSAQIQYTDRLFEGAGLVSGPGSSGLASSPLVTGAGGRLWIARDGRVRLELQSEGGDTEVLLDNRLLTAYVPSTNTLYRFRLPAAKPHANATGPAAVPGSPPAGNPHAGRVPTVAQIEEALTRAERHAVLSGAEPSDIAGQPAYTARISPREGGSLIGSLELSWDAVHGIPLRAALYSTNSSSPVIELAATEISYGPIEGSVFKLETPAGVKVVEPAAAKGSTSSPAQPVPAGPGPSGTHHRQHPSVKSIGHGIGSIFVLEDHSHSAAHSPSAGAPPQGLQTVKLGGVMAGELPTALGTILTFERNGVTYLVAGSRTAAAVEAVARGL